MSKIVIGYWDLRGLGEPIRLMLEYGGADYEDKRYPCPPPPYDHSTWDEAKWTLGLDFPNLPYIFDGELSLTESWAIMKYLGRKYGLMPAKGQESICDMLEGVVNDFRKSFTSMCYGDYEGQRETYFAKTLPGKLDLLQAFLAKHVWIAGSKLTHVDFALCEILNQMRLCNDGVLSGHPKVKAYLEKFESMEKIKAYRGSSRFKKMRCNFPTAKWGGEAE